MRMMRILPVPGCLNTPQTVNADGSFSCFSVNALSSDAITRSMIGKCVPSQTYHHSDLKIPPPFGCGDCCSRPDAM